MTMTEFDLVRFLLFCFCLTTTEGSVVRNGTAGFAQHQAVPVVITTWEFEVATDIAWDAMEVGGSNLDAVELGCTYCEMEESITNVGYGGKPDDEGETTLDAMIMDGKTHDVGAVGGLRRVKNAIGVARAVMKYTKHTLLVGDLATNFALEMGFPEEDLTTDLSREIWEAWINNNCQPNFRQNVVPDPSTSCGPYSPGDQDKIKKTQKAKRFSKNVNKGNHDTIGMVVVDAVGDIAAGTSTNGLTYKISGRVGDSPIPGAGSYADNDVGGAAATGDGDVMLRFLPSFYAVEKMAQGHSPSEACQLSLARIGEFYPEFNGALIAANKEGEYGAACFNYNTFPFAVRTADMEQAEVFEIECFN